MTDTAKTVVQCDFDGTITGKDVSFMMLEEFADGDWHALMRQYRNGQISVGRFNTMAFEMIKASREELLDTVARTMELRLGLPEMVAACRRKGFRFLVVSNGLDFYIEDILEKIGLGDVEVRAAETRFTPDGLRVRYLGPDNTVYDDGFKEAYVDRFLAEGCRVIYMGNGLSDIPSAIKCHHIFAAAELLDYCQKNNLPNYTPITDFYEVARTLETLF